MVFGDSGVFAREVRTASEDWRIWTSNDGAEITARLVLADATWVTLERDDGREFIVGINRLSTEDRVYIERVVNRIIFDHGLSDETREEILPDVENLIRNGDWSLGERYWDGDFEVSDGVLRLIPGEEVRYAFQDLRLKKLSERTLYKIRFRYRYNTDFLRWNSIHANGAARSGIQVKLGYCDRDGRLRIGSGRSFPKEADIPSDAAATFSEWHEFSNTISVEEADEQNRRYDVMLTFECKHGEGFMEIDDLILTEVGEVN